MPVKLPHLMSEMLVTVKLAEVMANSVTFVPEHASLFMNLEAYRHVFYFLLCAGEDACHQHYQKEN
jgi:hypothetical protein